MFQLLSFFPCLNELCTKMNYELCNPQVPISVNRLSSASHLCSSRIFKIDKLTFAPSEKTYKILFFNTFDTRIKMLKHINCC